MLPQCKMGNQCPCWSPHRALGAPDFLWPKSIWFLKIVIWKMLVWKYPFIPINIHCTELTGSRIMLTTMWTCQLMIHQDASEQLSSSSHRRDLRPDIPTCCLSAVSHCFLHSSELRVVSMAAHDSVITTIDQSTFINSHPDREHRCGFTSQPSRSKFNGL